MVRVPTVTRRVRGVYTCWTVGPSPYRLGAGRPGRGRTHGQRERTQTAHERRHGPAWTRAHTRTARTDADCTRATATERVTRHRHDHSTGAAARNDARTAWSGAAHVAASGRVDGNHCEWGRREKKRS
eukprot:6543490-Prymnesium_polylepis.2